MLEVNKLIIKPTKANDINLLHNDLRKEDKEELELLNLTPLEALLEGYAYSAECYSVFVNQDIIGMFGIATHYQYQKLDIPRIWYLGNDKINLVPKQWYKTSKYYINKFYKKYGTLTNIIWLKNKKIRQWLKHLGAIFDTPVNDFNHFYICKEI